MLSYGKRAWISRLGYVLSNLSIVFVVIGALAPLSGAFATVLSILLLFGWGVAVLFSLGLLLTQPDFLNAPSRILSLIENAGEWAERFFAAAPYLLGIGLACAVASIVLLAFEPSEKKHVPRIVFSCVVLLAAIVVIVLLLNGGYVQ